MELRDLYGHNVPEQIKNFTAMDRMQIYKHVSSFLFLWK